MNLLTGNTVPEHVFVIDQNIPFQEYVLISIFLSAAALSVAVDMGILQGMSMAWDDLVEYVQELQAK